MGATLLLNSKQLFYLSIINASRNWVMPVQNIALLSEGSYNGGRCIRIEKNSPSAVSDERGILFNFFWEDQK